MSQPETEVPAIVTRVGQAGFGELYFHGYRAFAELAGRTSLYGLLVLAITGRLPDASECAVLDDAAACAAFTDPRVWPHKAARLAASYGSSNAGIAVAALVCETHLIGPRVLAAGMRLLVDLAEALGPDIDDAAAVEREALRLLARGGRLVGFGVPGREVDERLIAFRKCLIQRGRERGRFVRLAESFIDAVARARGLTPNVSLVFAASWLDLGLPPEAGSALGGVLTYHGIVANAVEEARLQSPVLRRLPDACVRYEGAPSRTSPRALAAVAPR